MEKIIEKGAELLNEQLTDEMLEQANEIVTSKIRGTEERDRYCIVREDKISICCTTRLAYIDFSFKVGGDSVEFDREEGCFRD